MLWLPAMSQIDQTLAAQNIALPEPAAPVAAYVPTFLGDEPGVDGVGDAGRHARSAVSVPVLPLDASVEIDAIVAIRD